MVIENNGQLHPLEIKRSVNSGSELIGTFSILDKGSVPRGKGALICMRPELSAINIVKNIDKILLIIAQSNLPLCSPKPWQGYTLYPHLLC